MGVRVIVILSQEFYYYYCFNFFSFFPFSEIDSDAVQFNTFSQNSCEVGPGLRGLVGYPLAYHHTSLC